MAYFAQYVSKALRKVVMKRSYLVNFVNIYFKKQNNHSLRPYKRQKIILQYMIKKRKKNNFFFNNFNPKFVSGNKLFWNAAEPLSPNKGS